MVRRPSLTRPSESDRLPVPRPFARGTSSDRESVVPDEARVYPTRGLSDLSTKSPSLRTPGPLYVKICISTNTSMYRFHLDLRCALRSPEDRGPDIDGTFLLSLTHLRSLRVLSLPCLVHPSPCPVCPLPERRRRKKDGLRYTPRDRELILVSMCNKFVCPVFDE